MTVYADTNPLHFAYVNNNLIPQIPVQTKLVSVVGAIAFIS
jgi:hypothetical protein